MLINQGRHSRGNDIDSYIIYLCLSLAILMFRKGNPSSTRLRFILYTWIHGYAHLCKRACYRHGNGSRYWAVQKSKRPPWVPSFVDAFVEKLGWFMAFLPPPRIGYYTAIGGSKVGAGDVCPPPPIHFFFIFMQFLRKIGQNISLAFHLSGLHPILWKNLDPPSTVDTSIGVCYPQTSVHIRLYCFKWHKWGGIHK